ncbi:MAG: hypothetical protein IJ965_08055 [Campylobacter sp.]|nr:hypothetical protein [Campylobacter sp.]
MQGRILSEGVLRAEDGKRYTFSMSDIQNSQGIDELIGLEVDFELEDGVAKELIVLNIRQSSLQNNANTPNSATQQRDYGKCVELDPGIKTTYKIFHGIIRQNNESLTSSTEGPAYKLHRNQAYPASHPQQDRKPPCHTGKAPPAYNHA